MRDSKALQAHTVRAILGACLTMIQPVLADTPVMISTDRPSVADYSPVVPFGGLQIESGVLTTDTDSFTTVDAPEVMLRYGLLASTELRLTLPDYFWQLSHRCTNSATSSPVSETRRSA